MTVGILTFELHLPGAHSLKDKRQVVRSLKEGLRARHNVAVKEMGENADLWQRATIAVVTIAEGEEAARRILDTVLREAESRVAGHVVSPQLDFLEAWA